MCFMVTIGLTAAYMLQPGTPLLLQVAAFAIPASYVVVPVLHMNFRSLFAGVFYMFMIPTYVNVFTVYAFSNINDVSWGTKAIDRETLNDKLTRAAQEERENSFKNYRSWFMVMWLAANGALVSFITNADDPTIQFYYNGLFYVSTALNGVRLLGALGYLLIETCKTNSPTYNLDEDPPVPDPVLTNPNVRIAGSGPSLGTNGTVVSAMPTPATYVLPASVRSLGSVPPTPIPATPIPATPIPATPAGSATYSNRTADRHLDDETPRLARRGVPGTPGTDEGSPYSRKLRDRADSRVPETPVSTTTSVTDR